MATATITTLPAEILDLVFFDHCDVVDRAAVGRVCRRWRHLGRCRWRSRGHRYERPTWIDIVKACCDGRETAARWLVQEGAHWHCPLRPADDWACIEALRRHRPDLVSWLRDCGARWNLRTRAYALAKGYADALDQGAADGLGVSHRDKVAIATLGDLPLLKSVPLDGPTLRDDLDDIAVAAARFGHLSVLEWLEHKHACRFSAVCAFAAGRGGHSAVVHWLTCRRVYAAVAVEVAIVGDIDVLGIHRGNYSASHVPGIVSVVAAHGHLHALNGLIDVLPPGGDRTRIRVCKAAVHRLPKQQVLPFLRALVDRFGADRVLSWLPPGTVDCAIERNLCDVAAWMIDLGCGWPSVSTRRGVGRSSSNLVVWALIDLVDGTSARASLFFRALADGWKPPPGSLYRSLCAMEHAYVQNSTRNAPAEVVLRALIDCGHCPWTDKARRLALAVCSTETALLALSGLEARDATAHAESIRIAHPHKYAALIARLDASSSL
ncbi:F-box incomplete domain containing protein [Pandoravirus salinus]|uniref:F-box incomplete domain containing protein n=1 Tax=Pandoravirus salinus TaxID=1349410 RepID=S4W3B5_9VIRU|nr:F-box incomplete domain [Pandoravirus salinus]AGO85107.2 F-box incomplete domain containing protein [Pandoravirus salinus]